MSEVGSSFDEVEMSPTQCMTAKADVPPEMRALFGKPPVLISEDLGAYEALLAAIASTVRPTDCVEWILVKDYADLTWEIQRIRRAKAGILDVTRKEALRSILESILEDENHEYFEGDRFSEADAKSEEWFIYPYIKEELLERLKRYGLDEDAITSQAYALRSRELEKIEYILASAEARRNAMLREVSLYREAFVHRLRQTPEVVDSDIKEISLAPGSGPSQAIEG